MTDLEKEIHKLITIAEKKGLTKAVEFFKGFLAKEKVINDKQRKHSQIPK